MAPPTTTTTTTDADKRQAAREVVDILEEIATLLNTKLNRTQLSYCISLIENGVNPEALAVSFFFAFSIPIAIPISSPPDILSTSLPLFTVVYRLFGVEKLHCADL
ncbi:mitotic-spindle organizing gamma-tubulin ring associated-domain-containing protein [Phyllosticta paracitricarpa]|uniref:Mitotic-spindle organizing protein 1 n=1 Tax=Phyllosticta paracitricarpa TaxID=2016321 RepID=A0ABR1N4D3_9PEZI